MESNHKFLLFLLYLQVIKWTVNGWIIIHIDNDETEEH